MILEEVAVTGGAGRLGRYVVQELAQRYAVTVIDQVGGNSLSETAHTIDILKLNPLKSILLGKHAVVHLAGIDAHRQAAPEAFFETNVLGTWNVLQAAFEVGIRKVVICSSSSATGLNASNPSQPPLYLPIDEDHPLAPVEAYGLSKQLNEITGASFARRTGMQVVCIRPTYIAFPELITHLAASAKAVDVDSVHADTEMPLAFREAPPLLRTYVDPVDLARCFRLALEFRSSGFDLFWASATDTFEPEATLTYLERIYGVLPDVRKPSIFSRNPHASPIECLRAEKALGWRPTMTWQDLLASISLSPERR